MCRFWVHYQEVEVFLGLRAPENVTDSFAIRKEHYLKQQAKQREQLIVQYGLADRPSAEIEQFIQKEKVRRDKQKRSLVKAHKSKLQNRKKSKKRKK